VAPVVAGVVPIDIAEVATVLEFPGMSEPTPEEYANLYIRGVNEAAAGVELEAQEVLDVLDVFGEDGMRWYLIGHLEGIKDREEAELEEYEMLEASLAFEVHESSVSILEETENTLQVWVELAPKNLSTEVNLHIVNDEEEILQGGRIVRIEFKDAVDDDAERGLATNLRLPQHRSQEEAATAEQQPVPSWQEIFGAE
jgi:hypothetical protein